MGRARSSFPSSLLLLLFAVKLYSSQFTICKKNLTRVGKLQTENKHGEICGEKAKRESCRRRDLHRTCAYRTVNPMQVQGIFIK